MERQAVPFLPCRLEIGVSTVTGDQDTEIHTFDHLDLVVCRYTAMIRSRQRVQPPGYCQVELYSM
jgi:hypothetical protein